MPEPRHQTGSETEGRDPAREVDALLDRIRQPGVGGLFAPGSPLVVARAPGRLDVMGGIADYSGSLVLQWPIREATLAAAQSGEEPGLQLVSLPVDSAHEPRRFELDAASAAKLLSGDYDAARRFFSGEPELHWAAYVVGVLAVLRHELGSRWEGGLRILIDSRVPEGKGVSSSAALEVATMQAVAGLLGVAIDGKEMARLCQMAENFVVGAPCGIMDQMTSALGRSDALLALLCQPATVQGFVPLPSSIAFWGIDSGIRHAVSGSDYTSVRTGAFMGYRMIADAAGLRPAGPPGRESVLKIDDPRWSGYLANLTPQEFEDSFASTLPETIPGAEFLARFGGTTDKATRVDPGRVYAVRQPAAHPIYEHARVKRFAELLAGRPDEAGLIEMGELMYGSHASYSACGLGSDGTNLLVELVRQAGPARGLYGAKITGGGSGGTVAVLGEANAGAAVAEIARQYRERTGREPYLFAGSSPGACSFGVRRVQQ